MAIARFPNIVIDCPDPAALAKFYGTMLDWKIEISSDRAEVRAEYGDCISFQQVDPTCRHHGRRRFGPSKCIST
jgi:hypothetical protein